MCDSEQEAFPRGFEILNFLCVCMLVHRAKLWLKQTITSSKSCTLLFRVWQGWCWRSWFGRMTGPPQLPASTQLFTAPMGQFYNLFFVSSYIKTSYSSVLGTCATSSCTAPLVRTLKGGARVMVALTVARKNYANLRHFCTIFKPNFAYKSKEIATSWTIKNIREL